MKQAMIFCAGLGTRLRPITDNIPKPLVKVNGKPILGYMLDYLIKCGYEHIVINTHYLPEQIESFIDNFYHLKMKFGIIPNLRLNQTNDFGSRDAQHTNRYVSTAESRKNHLDHLKMKFGIKTIHEPTLLGSGGGLKNAITQGLLDPNYPIFAVNGDIIFLDNDLYAFNLLQSDKSESKISMLVQPFELSKGFYNPPDFSLGDDGRIYKYNNNILGPGYICPGLHLIKDPDIILEHPKEIFSLNEFYYQEYTKGIVNDKSFWLHIGDQKGLEEAEVFINT